MRTKLSLALMCLLTGASAFAEPTLYPKNIGLLAKVQNTTTSNIIADDSDASVVWVMPPNSAKAAVQDMTMKTANLGFCKDMGKQQEYIAKATAQFDILQSKINGMADEVTQLQRVANEKKEAAANFASTSLVRNLPDLDNTIAANEGRLTELYPLQTSCNKPETCASIQNEIDALAKEQAVLRSTRAKLIKENNKDFRTYARMKAVSEAAKVTADEATGTYSKMQTELDAIQDKFLDVYNKYGAMEGAHAKLTYNSDWDQNIAALRSKNPGYTFAKMATKNATLMAEVAEVTNIVKKGAIMGIAIAGKRNEGGGFQFPSYPENISSTVVLSLVGACPMEHPEYFDMKASRIIPYGIVISYDYDTTFIAKAKATYNMYKMYEKIMNSGSSGGFFRSRSWSSVEEKNVFSDSFVVEWDDRENTLSAEDKLIREQEMRHSVLTRLATLALPVQPNVKGLIDPGAPPTRGAIVLSNELMKNCPGNAYCVAGASIMRVLDAIFGKSSSNAVYTNLQNVDVSENYSNAQKITKAAITSYL